MMPHYNIKLTVVRHVEVHGVDEVIVRVVPGLVTGPEDNSELSPESLNPESNSGGGTWQAADIRKP